MNLKLSFAVLLIAVFPLCGYAANVTNADAQKVVKMIADDSGKHQTYCDVLKLSKQIEETDPNDADKNKRIDELETKLGPEYIALLNGLRDMDPDSEESKEINSTLEPLDKSCEN
jgi:hypothetical protein